MENDRRFRKAERARRSCLREEHSCSFSGRFLRKEDPNFKQKQGRVKLTLIRRSESIHPGDVTHPRYVR